MVGAAAADAALTPRTLRQLQHRGLAGIDCVGCDIQELAERLRRGASWLLRAGAWPARAVIDFPPPSATLQPLAGFGATLAAAGEPALADADAWRALLTRTGGALGQVSVPVASVYLDARLSRSLAAALAPGLGWDVALQGVLADSAARQVRFAPLDVHHDPALRVAQLVTSIQQGGAERVALLLARELPAHGVRSRLFAFGAPTRSPLAVPADLLVDLAHTSRFRRERVAAAAQALASYDVVHGHLLEKADIDILNRCAAPLMLTLHNTRPGWPAGTAELAAGDAALLVACARSVETELAQARLGIPLRTVWNGIDQARVLPSPERAAAAVALRAQLSLGPHDVVLLSLANPRPQKCLDRLPPLLRALGLRLRARGDQRRVWLLVAGAPSSVSPSGLAALSEFRASVAACGVAPDVRELGAVDDVATLLAASDVLVSTSRYEGLSLAHVEALSAGRPVVATDAGGTHELCRAYPGLQVLPQSAGPEALADAVLTALAAPPAPATPHAADFSSARMAEGYARLYPRLLAGVRARSRAGVLLVTNNFSTGGAQRSAQRLLLALHARGIRAAAAVVQEQPQHPTPGRAALTAAGVPVIALPPASAADPAHAVAQLLEQCDAAPPQSVLLWNLIPVYKLLLAELLLGPALYDVSPGEMYYDSLARYFAAPRPGLAYRAPQDYGARLSGVIVKYAAEAARARQYLGAPVHVIPNGVPLPPWRPRPPHAALVIGTLARLAPHKRIEDLIEALRRAHPHLPAYRLRIAGGPEPGAEAYAPWLREQAVGLPVEWLGEVSDTDGFLCGLDLFVSISEPAGCPNALLEALAAGCAVIATANGGASEQIRDGIGGRLVPPRQSEALCAALLEAAHDPAARARWGAAGRRHVEQHFSGPRMLADYVRLLLPASPPQRASNSTASMSEPSVWVPPSRQG